ncbi:hypothetical protein Tco_0004494 [Tanacetum coccineum]
MRTHEYRMCICHPNGINLELLDGHIDFEIADFGASCSRTLDLGDIRISDLKSLVIVSDNSFISDGPIDMVLELRALLELSRFEIPPYRAGEDLAKSVKHFFCENPTIVQSSILIFPFDIVPSFFLADICAKKTWHPLAKTLELLSNEITANRDSLPLLLLFPRKVKVSFP